MSARADTFWLDPCPDSVWKLLPGGPVALNEVYQEAWQYHGSEGLRDEAGEPTGQIRHCFRHRAHPDYKAARMVAFVNDGDAGPVLGTVAFAPASRR